MLCYGKVSVGPASAQCVGVPVEAGMGVRHGLEMFVDPSTADVWDWIYQRIGIDADLDRNLIALLGSAR